MSGDFAIPGRCLRLWLVFGGEGLGGAMAQLEAWNYATLREAAAAFRSASRVSQGEC